jgi:hypothetical protein
MPSLADIQAAVARAVVGGWIEPFPAKLVGGTDPDRRLSIHRRHYETSLVTALRQKLPATSWLAGQDLVAAGARAYVSLHPPRTPCIADYGDDFPAFLADFDRAARIPYLRSFAELELAVGRASIAIDSPPLTWTDIAGIGSESLLDSRLTMQPGLCYLRSPWAIDSLIKMYLADSEAESFFLADEATLIEIRGARGSLWIERLDPATFCFRSALRHDRSIGDAAGEALECDDRFDPGGALRELVQAGLAVQISTSAKRGET